MNASLRPADKEKGEREQGTKPSQIKLATKAKITTTGTGIDDKDNTRTEFFMTTGKKTGPGKMENHHLDGTVRRSDNQYPDAHGKMKYKFHDDTTGKEYVMSSSSTARPSL